MYSETFERILSLFSLFSKIESRSNYLTFLRDSPHVHSFSWVLNPPNIEDNIDIYKKIVDSVISANIPTEAYDPPNSFTF